MKLHLGCGQEYKQGWINVDTREYVKTDMKFDLDVFPYPFKDNSVDAVYMKQVLEHLNHPIKVLKELHRICKKGAIIQIFVPHANSYAHNSGIEHRGNYTECSFNMPNLIELELDKKLKLNKCEFLYDWRYKKYIPFKKYLNIYLNGIYDDIYFEFEVMK